MHRHVPELHDGTPEDGGERGRARFKDKGGPMGQKRAQSAHGNLLARGGATLAVRPNIVVDQSPSLERPQSKDDKNKNNAIIANNNNSARMFSEATTPKVRPGIFSLN
jgi:hypothetical protein